MDDRSADSTAYEQMATDPQFAELRRRFRVFVFPMSVAFLIWYLAYVLLATYAAAFMSTKVLGEINIGLIIGLLQFVTTFAITMSYVRYANRRLDPLAEQLRAKVEGGGQ